MAAITPYLWFDTQGLDAAEFYVSLFPNSAVTDVSYYGEGAPLPAGTPMTVSFTLDGFERSPRPIWSKMSSAYWSPGWCRLP